MFLFFFFQLSTTEMYDFYSEFTNKVHKQTKKSQFWSINKNSPQQEF